MRIVGGTCKGRRIVVPKGLAVRPTPDRVREALFHILGHLIDVQGASVLDLFAGSGALGLEALSRGAAFVHFVELDRKHVAHIRSNVDLLGLAERGRVEVGEVTKVVRRLAARKLRVDLVFADPPYRKGLLEPALHALADCGILAPGALVVAEHPASEPPPDMGAREWSRTGGRAYGDVGLTWWSVDGPPQLESRDASEAP